MVQGKLRKAALVLIALYTALTLFFLFWGFDRSAYSGDSVMRYNLTFEGIPLHFPTGRSFEIWFFDLGNFIAFIPFGMVIPLLYRTNFIRFVTGFLLAIVFIEFVQMVTRLGAFDINDIIINTLGAAVGYWSQRFVAKEREQVKGIAKIALSGIVCALLTFLVVSSLNHYLRHVEREAVALHELPLQDGTVVWDNNLTGFTAGLKRIEPQINLYSGRNPGINEFTVWLNGEYAKLSGYVAIPDNAIDMDGKGRSAIYFIADGIELYSIDLLAESGLNQQMSFQVPLDGTEALTIKVANDYTDPDTMVIMWDVELTRKRSILNLIRNGS